MRSRCDDKVKTRQDEINEIETIAKGSGINQQLKNPYFERPNSTPVPIIYLNPENPVDPV